MAQIGTFYFDHGNKAIILLHAFASSPVDVRLLARRLEKENYSIYAPLFTGHGTADFTDIITDGSPEKWWQDVVNAIEFVKAKGKTEISIFGISLGGIFAAKALEMYPELVGGGSFGSPIVRNGRSDNVRSTFLQMAVANYRQFKVDEGTIKNKVQWLDDNIDPLLDEINDFANGVAEDLAKIHQPYFIGQGLADEMVDSQSGQRIQEKLINSQVDFHEYPDASHMITVNSAHADLETDLKSFLNRIY
ncbi:alpha/beta hydrolase [Lentilactobacillus sp. SPB1-3]|uniref:Alpha/beta hydrolase n=1 Tax=Lentilactobacillus terminaliae TaxID=3003483 RepID=A0ACD5DHT3_9LACO|nr:alpha/beta fold hydrolase [Lentilactobacillus sp. SPB1-3]MCZ0976978.1 alpha/beta fold hydrolase [Lentilactobacillus sp. SPB1-3]